MTPEEMRLNCLNAAVKSCTGYANPQTPEVILDRANKFLVFVTRRRSSATSTTSQKGGRNSRPKILSSR